MVELLTPRRVTMLAEQRYYRARASFFLVCFVASLVFNVALTVSLIRQRHENRALTGESQP